MSLCHFFHQLSLSQPAYWEVTSTAQDLGALSCPGEHIPMPSCCPGSGAAQGGGGMPWSYLACAYLTASSSCRAFTSCCRASWSLSCMSSSSRMRLRCRSASASFRTISACMEARACGGDRSHQLARPPPVSPELTQAHRAEWARPGTAHSDRSKARLFLCSGDRLCHSEPVLAVRSEMGSLSSLAPALVSHCPPAKDP